jgi:hypothetical protein
MISFAYVSASLSPPQQLLKLVEIHYHKTLYTYHVTTDPPTPSTALPPHLYSGSPHHPAVGSLAHLVTCSSLIHPAVSLKAKLASFFLYFFTYC